MKTFAILSSDDTVVNIVVADTLAKVTVSSEFRVRLVTTDVPVAIGGRWGNEGFIPKERPEPAAPNVVSKLLLVRAMRRIDLWDKFKIDLSTAALDVQEDWTLAHHITQEDFVVFGMGLGLTSTRRNALFTSSLT